MTIKSTIRFEQAMDHIDDYNRMDPNQEEFDGKSYPKELLYGRRMSHMLCSFYNKASEPLRLAVRCQHIGRWEIPRSSYPMDRVGYLNWRNDLKKHHANIAEGILKSVGYDEDIIERVKFLIEKKQLRKDEETQTLEDVVCLVFLTYYFEDFAKQHDEEKVIDILVKTWNKMSDKGHQEALKLHLSEYTKAMVGKALA